MVEFMSFLFAIGVGFGLSCLIFGTILDKSNNIGDSRGSKDEYQAYVTFTRRDDGLKKDEKSSFCYRYAEKIDNQTAGPSGSSLVRRLTDEELSSYKTAPVNAPVQNNNANTAVSTEDEFEKWASTQTSDDMSGVFKPYKPN